MLTTKYVYPGFWKAVYKHNNLRYETKARYLTRNEALQALTFWISIHAA